ncbi:hypothetical protein LSM04_007336 [Trypanosoma melophagium]|uniref:uncharacterized protein n=1 Tax=Trypanosoma melophagium TaxID=715481 RepID=UPI00351A6780|nr:hypothetical protein LSM04_007336 [Trypanosoma melophagium]
MDNNSLFTKAATSFIYNIVAVGVCSSEGCLNAYNSSIFTLPSSIHSCVPVSPPTAASMEEAITTETFPLGMMGRRLCSSSKQLQMFLEEFVKTLFEAAQKTFGCSVSTLLHSLWLLERMQVRNILLHQRNTIALRNVSYQSKANKINDPQENIFSEYLPQITSRVPLAKSYCRSSRSCSNLSSDDKNKCVSLLLSPVSSDIYSIGPNSEGEDDTLCRTCSGSDIFSLQLWNVQLFLSASLLLSMKVNEDTFADVMEEVVSSHVGAAAGCDSNLLRCAERCIFEVLWDELKVTKKGQIDVMRRLGMECISF